MRERERLLNDRSHYVGEKKRKSMSINREISTQQKSLNGGEEEKEKINKQISK